MSNLTVHEQGRYDVDPDALWERIGDFHTINTWVPGIEGSERRGDDVRALSLGAAGTVVETKVAEGPRTYSYRIDESPLPVADYVAKIAVSPDGDGSVVDWSAEFVADGASDEEAKQTISGIFRAGLDAI